MGLDMYIYRAKTPELKMGIYDADDEYISSLVQLPKEETENPMYKQLLPFAARIQIVNHQYDFDAIAKDYCIGDNVGVSSFNSATTIFSGNNGSTPPIPNETVKEKYTRAIIQTRFVVDIEEVYYWRKAYDIQSLICREIETAVENCGFYKITENIARKIHEMDNKFPTTIVNDKNANIFYHEWY